MTRRTKGAFVAAVAGQVGAQLGWLDPLFVPLVLLGPVVTGAVASARSTPFLWVAVLWCSTGIGMAWSDWLVNREDLAFHLALAVLMPLLAGLAYGAVRLATRPRRPGRGAGQEA
jgi:hypothetical protein